MKAFNFLTGLITGLLVVLFVAGTALALDPEGEEFQVKPGGLLEIKCKSGGSIAVRGWDRDVVKIIWYDDMNDLDDWNMDVKESSDGLKLVARMKNRRNHSNSLQFEVMVPAEYDIEFESGGGGFYAEGITGTFDGTTGGGELVLTNVSGRAYLTTGGGEIEVTDSKLDGRMNTGGGPVLVENVVGNLKAASGGGNVQYVNVRDEDGDVRGPAGSNYDGSTDDTVLISNAGGGINVRKASDGAVVSTGGGDINVRRADKFVDARTGAGDIHVEIAEDGDVDEETVIISGYGEIWLEVPKGFGMTLEVEIAYTRNSRHRFEIDTDLDIDENRTEKWDYSHGNNSKKYIYGTGIFGNGDHMINIRTTNGDVHITER